MIKRSVDETISAIPGTWRFDAEVWKSFESHVRKSVPFYDEMQRMVGELSEFFVRDDSTVYDLGSSTGTTLNNLAALHEAKENVRFVGVDLSESMVDGARAATERSNVSFLHKDVLDVEFSPPANLVLSVLTLQFLTLADRRRLLQRIHDGLVEGGGLIVIEKAHGDHAVFQSMWTELHWDFKRRQGLSPEQILEKANSIRGVLNPLSPAEHVKLFKQTGFDQVEIFFKWYNWAGYLAQKNDIGLAPARRNEKGHAAADGMGGTASNE